VATAAAPDCAEAVPLAVRVVEGAVAVTICEGAVVEVLAVVVLFLVVVVLEFAVAVVVAEAFVVAVAAVAVEVGELTADIAAPPPTLQAAGGLSPQHPIVSGWIPNRLLH
jgi:hypothetical protein